VLFWIPVFLLAGWLLRRVGVGGEVLPSRLAAWALHVALPATVLKVLAGMPLERLVHPAVLLPWLLLVPMFVLLRLLLSRLRFLQEPQARLLLLMGLLGNTSFLGLPLLQATMGDGALSPALLYDQFASFPQLLLLGTLLLEGPFNGGGSWGSGALKRLLRFPPLPVLFLALSPLGLPLRNAFMPALAWLAWTLVPVVMLSLGGRLRFRLNPLDIKPLALGLVVKMAVAPSLLLLVIALLGLRHPDMPVVVLECAMPPMATAAAWAADRQCAPALAAALVSVGIVVAMVWIPLLAALLPRILSQ